MTTTAHPTDTRAHLDTFRPVGLPRPTGALRVVTAPVPVRVDRATVVTALRIALAGTATPGRVRSLHGPGQHVRALTLVTDDRGCSRCVPVNAVVVDHRAVPVGADHRFAGTVYAVVVDTAGNLYAATETEAAYSERRVADFAPLHAAMVGFTTDPARGPTLEWLPRDIPALSPDILRCRGAEHYRPLVARYEGALADAIASAVADPSEENVAAVWWAEARREAAYGRFLVS